MKTGQFAKKYNLTTNGIRWYVEQGLLLPKTVGHHYDFDEDCIETMEKIQKYKELKFTLPEISRIFHVKMLTRYTYNADAVQKYNRIFKNKEEEIRKIIEELENCQKQLKKEIRNLPSRQHEVESGIHIDNVNMLECPICHGGFMWENVSINGNKIVDGSIRCACGYSITIDNGILIGRQSRHEAVEWSNILNLMTEYSTEYLNMESKLYYEMFREMEKQLDVYQESGKKGSFTVLTSGGYAGDFICTYPDLIPEGSSIIFADQNLSVVRYIRDKLGWLNDKYKIIYMCDEKFNLPLKERCVDMFLDDYSSSEFIFYDNQYPLQKVRRFIKPGGLVGGCYTYYKEGSTTASNIKSSYPGTRADLFTLRNFKKSNAQNGLDIIVEKCVGSIMSPGNGYAFDYHNEADLLNFYFYFAKRK